MARVAKNSDPEKLIKLKMKLNDQLYMDQAIRRIAMTLSDEILHMSEDYSGSRQRS